MYFEEIGAKWIFGKSASLDLNNSRKLEIALVVPKNDQIEEKDRKVKAKQLRNKKQHLKRIKNKDKTCQQTIDKALFSPPTSYSGPDPASSSVATRLSASGFSAFGPFISRLSAFRLSISRPSISHSSSVFFLISVRLFYPMILSALERAFHPIVFSSWAFFTSK